MSRRVKNAAWFGLGVVAGGVGLYLIQMTILFTKIIEFVDKVFK